MCGIVAGVSAKDVVPILLEGLRRLEYRGYDSCGIAVCEAGKIDRVRTVKRVNDLCRQVQETGLHGTLGIAHTRWATHGGPVVANAHPHIAGGRIALVHNGIIENYAELRDELKKTGVVFESQTDTEVLAQLVNFYYNGDLLEAVKTALNRVRGAYAIAGHAAILHQRQRSAGARRYRGTGEHAVPVSCACFSWNRAGAIQQGRKTGKSGNLWSNSQVGSFRC